jgi:Dehydrogenases with different specificities (related to short-chain alcohol dehydrogenases)
MKDVYVITGAAGGMGADIASKITKSGILLLSDINKNKLKEIEKKLKEKNIEAYSMHCDVSDELSIKKLAERAKTLGKFKALIHTAGISGVMGTVEEIFTVNLIGTKLLMDEFYKISDKSIIINIASIAGHMVPDSGLYNDILVNPLSNNFMSNMKLIAGGKTEAAYALSKKGVIMITEREVARWAKKNSRIVSVSPGAFDTDMVVKEKAESDAIDFMVENTPIPRVGHPREITELIKYLLDEKSEFINGTDIVIDGGITGHMKYNDIFGLKENKIPKLLITGLYTFIFLFAPLVLRMYVTEEFFTNFLTVSLVLYYPLILVLITGCFSKRKMSPTLILIPTIIFIINALKFFTIVEFIYLPIYMGIVLLTNFAVKTCKNRNKKPIK